VIAAALLACAANIAPVTLEAVIEVESRGDALAVHVNGQVAQPHRPADAREAAMLARNYISQGYSVNLGLMQVNNRNLPALGYTVEEVLNDPCTNIRAGGAVLAADSQQRCGCTVKAKLPFRLRSAPTIPAISIEGSQTATSPATMRRVAYQD